MPLVLQRREALISGRANVGSLLLTVRRLAIFAILLLAYMYYRSAGEAQLASIGLLSFAASRNSRRRSSAACSGGARPPPAPSPA